MFWRWSVRSYHGCLVFLGFFFGDILVAGRETEDGQCPHCPSAVRPTPDLFCSPPPGLDPQQPRGWRGGGMKTGVTIKRHEIKRTRRVLLRLEEAADEMSWRRPWEIRQTLMGLLCMRRRARRLSVEIPPPLPPHPVFFFFCSKQNKDEAFFLRFSQPQPRAGACVGDEER